MRKASFCCILLSFLLLTACQSTPSQAPVYQKKDLAQVVARSKCGPSIYQYEKELNKQWSFKNIHFDIQAKVSVPDTDRFPVYCAKPKVFSRDLLIRMIGFFEPGRQWYEFGKDQFTYAQKSKARLEEEYIRLKADSWFRAHSPEDYAASLAEYEQLIKSAPEVFDPPKFDLYAQVKENGNFSIGTDIQSDTAYIDISCSDNSSAFNYSKGKGVQLEKFIELDGKKPVPIEIDEQSAIAMGDKAVKDLGLNGFMKLAHAERAFLIGNDVYGSVKSGGWLLVYLMRAGELDSVYVGEGALISPGNEPEYSAPPWEQQSIEIFVDKAGVQYFYWRGYSDITEMVADNVQLISFEEVKSRIIKQLEYRYKPMADTFDSETIDEAMTISVREISLGTALLALKDDTTKAYMVPVWYIPYTIQDVITYKDGKTPPRVLNMEDALVINAIDGSVAEPRVSLSGLP